MNNIVIEKEASAFRLKNGLGANDPIRLKSILNNLDVVTVYKRLSGDFSGMALKVNLNENNINRFILVNSTHSFGDIWNPIPQMYVFSGLWGNLVNVMHEFG